MLCAVVLLGSVFASAQTPAPSAVPARAMPLLLPGAIAFNARGDLYIAETQRSQIRVVDTLGNISNFAGNGIQGFSGDGASALSANLNSPQGLAVDLDGNVYIADTGNNRVRRVDAVSGAIRTVAGNGIAVFTGDQGSAVEASLNLPRSICLSATGNGLYIADTRNHRIRFVDLTSGIVRTFAGSGVQGLSGDGGPARSAALDSPDGVALDPDGNLYIADTGNRRVRQISAATNVISTVIAPDPVPKAAAVAPSITTSNLPSLARPRAVASDPAGNLYIADSGNHRLLRLDHSTGSLSVAAGDITQGFSGDGGAAIAASLDSPRAVTLSPGGLVSIADSGNQRVRQLLSQPAPATLIRTIAGLGVVIPGSFSLSAPAVTAYGSGSLRATLNASAPATGQVTFLDLAEPFGGVVGTSLLVANSAVASTSGLSAGQHRFLATYAGDSTHAAAQTPVTVVQVSPLGLIASPASATMSYGSPVPVLGGSLFGLLPQDAARVSASFSTSASSKSAVGNYPVSVALSGSGALNYLLQPGHADLVITQAASLTVLHNDALDGISTDAFHVQVSSTTSGTPSGSVTLLDNGAALQKSALTSAGSAAFSQLALSPGTHTLGAIYSGDGNFLPSSSPPLAASIALTPVADFTIAAISPSSQILLPGGSVTYNFIVHRTGSELPSPITLSILGMPAFTTSSFSPAYLPPGSPSATLALTVTSLASSAMRSPGNRPPSALALSFPLLAVLLLRTLTPKKRGALTLTAALLALSLAPALSGCGDRTNAAAGSGNSLQSYNLAVTGSATDIKGAPVVHAVNLVLQMKRVP